MGSGGQSLKRGTAKTQSTNISNDISEFMSEIESRNYGTSSKMVPEQQQREFKRLKSELTRAISDTDEGNVVMSSGFALGDENYVHTTAKLNQYQRLVRSEVRKISFDLKLGVINEDEAKKRLKVLKSIDATIQDRRRTL